MATQQKRVRRKSSRDRVRTYRERMRAQGLRPVQIWLPDTNSRAFIREARRQSALIAADGGDRDDQAFVDSITDWGDD